MCPALAVFCELKMPLDGTDCRQAWHWGRQLLVMAQLLDPRCQPVVQEHAHLLARLPYACKYRSISTDDSAMQMAMSIWQAALKP